MLRFTNTNNLFRFGQAAKILISNSHSIYFNLAFEEYLFETATLTCPTLLLYRNYKTIVIGRHQNPWKECKTELMKEENVVLSRRKTGGGAVYQDLGNTCFSFLTPYEGDSAYDYKSVNNQLLTAAFARLGISIEVAGRNDLHYQGKKISGSAYRLNLGGSQGRGRKALHHGTVLFNVDLGALQKFLNPNRKKLESKGIDSVRSRVMNLKQVDPDIDHESFCKALEKQFIHYYSKQINDVSKEECNEDELVLTNQTIKKNYQRLSNWDWLYGSCPEFKYTIDNKFSWGFTEVTINVIDGIIRDGKVYSDCLFPDFITVVNEEIVKKVKYDRQGLQKLQNALVKRLEADMHVMARELCAWMRAQL